MRSLPEDYYDTFSDIESADPAEVSAVVKAIIKSPSDSYYLFRDCLARLILTAQLVDLSKMTSAKATGILADKQNDYDAYASLPFYKRRHKELAIKREAVSLARQNAHNAGLTLLCELTDLEYHGNDYRTALAAGSKHYRDNQSAYVEEVLQDAAADGYIINLATMALAESISQELEPPVVE